MFDDLLTNYTQLKIDWRGNFDKNLHCNEYAKVQRRQSLHSLFKVLNFN